MPVTGLHHFTIRCDAEDLPELEKFYVEVFDLRVGERPALRHPGRWLYGDAGQAIVHLNAVGRPRCFDDNSLITSHWPLEDYSRPVIVCNG